MPQKICKNLGIWVSAITILRPGMDSQKVKEDFVFSTKVGRLFTSVPESEVPPTMWKNPLDFDFKHMSPINNTIHILTEFLRKLMN